MNLNNGETEALHNNGKNRGTVCRQMHSLRPGKNKPENTERKIPSPKERRDGWKLLQKNDELHRKVDKLSDIIRKHRPAFYGHLMRLDENRLIKEVFDHESFLNQMVQKVQRRSKKSIVTNIQNHR